MRKRYSWTSLLSALLLAALAHAAPVQRIHEIQHPLLSVPVIVEAGDTFSIKLKLPADKEVSDALLKGSADASQQAKLRLGVPVAADELTEIQTTVPLDTPEALYDLTVSFSDGSSDTQPHSVKVVREFKKQFDFIHLTDIHFNVVKKNPGSNPVRIKLLQDASSMAPEFILFSGDLALYPKAYDADYADSYENFIEHLKAPMFMAPGNHELYIDRRGEEPIDGRDYWDAAYGPMHHSFDYGNLHVVSINTFDWPDRWRDRYHEEDKKAGAYGMAYIGPEQWDWLQKDLKTAAAANKKIIAHTHIPLELLQGGRMIGAVNPEKMKGPSLAKFTKFLNHFNVSHVFAGHLHFNAIRELGTTKEVLTIGAGNAQKDEDPRWGFRIVHVSDGEITGMDIHEIGYDDLN